MLNSASIRIFVAFGAFDSYVNVVEMMTMTKILVDSGLERKMFSVSDPQIYCLLVLAVRRVESPLSLQLSYAFSEPNYLDMNQLHLFCYVNAYVD